LKRDEGAENKEPLSVTFFVTRRYLVKNSSLNILILTPL